MIQPSRFCRFLIVLAIALVGGVAQADVLKGVVRNPEGNPVTGATVWLHLESGPRSVTTDGEGRYRFSDTVVGTAHLVARHPDYSLAGQTLFLVAGGEVDLAMAPASAITLRVLSESFIPVAGARVTWMDVAGRFMVPAEALAGDGFPLLRTDDDGLLPIPNLPEGEFVRLRLAHYRYADTHVEYLPVDASSHEVVMVEGDVIRGRVTAEGKGIENAQLSVYQIGAQGQREFGGARTDPDGFYNIRVPGGQYMTAVRHHAWASPVPQSLETTDGEPVTINFELIPPRALSGTVLLPDGKPCPGVRLSYRVDDTVYEETFTNGDGGFSLKVPSPTGVLHVTPPAGYLTEALAAIPVDMGEVDAVELDPIKLRALPRITGRVLDEDNQPTPEALISSTSLEAPVWAIPDAEGNFEIQLQYAPEETQINFEVEHSLRFQRGAFTANIRRPRDHEVFMKSFVPDTGEKSSTTGNALDHLRGEAAPPLSCRKWFNGEALELPELAGKVVVLLFWGGFDDSPEGIDRIEEIRAIHRLYENREDVQIIGIHDSSSDPEEVEQYIARRGITFPVGLDGDRLETFDAYSINYIPEVVLIGKDGRVRYFETRDRLVTLIKALRRE
jgi:peroxiredoxin